jgi:hypothetical protein
MGLGGGGLYCPFPQWFCCSSSELSSYLQAMEELDIEDDKFTAVNGTDEGGSTSWQISQMLCVLESWCCKILGIHAGYKLMTKT